MAVTVIEEIEKILFEAQDLGIEFMRPFHEKHGVNYLKLSILRETAKSDSITLNQLGEMLGKAVTNLSVVVSTMEKEGFVKRTKSVNDARSSYIQITPKGRKISRASYEYMQESFAEVINSREILDNLLEALIIYRDALKAARLK